MEFPQLHRGNWTRPYRFGYGLSAPYENGEIGYGGPTGFIRYDLQTGKRDEHNLQPHNSANEAFFVSAGKSEEEGYLLSYVYDAREQLSELWILDATSLAAGPVAKIKLPARVPQGFSR